MIQNNFLLKLPRVDFYYKLVICGGNENEINYVSRNMLCFFSVKLTKWPRSQMWGPRQSSRSRTVLLYSWPLNGGVGVTGPNPCAVRNPRVTFDFPKT